MTDRSGLPVLIAAAGTGGHVFPALAVGEELAHRGFDLHWVGTARGIEARVVPTVTYRMHRLPVAGLRGRSLSARARTLALTLYATGCALALMWRIRPRAVLAMGGYVSGPVGLAAWLARRRLVVHEQNAIPGFTNRVVGRLATCVLETVPGSFPARYRAEAVGNPVRKEIARLAAETRERAPGAAPRVLIVGGSQGAASLNRALPAALSRIAAACVPFSVCHQTGPDRVEAVAAAYRSAGVEAEVLPFIEDMAAKYREADLIVARAGAGSTAEITLAGLPALFVPYPYAVDDHQTANARALVESGAAVMFRDDALDSDDFRGALEALLTDTSRREAMAAASRRLSKPGAAAAVADAVVAVTGEGGGG